jgi:hypothetical protein
MKVLKKQHTKTRMRRDSNNEHPVRVFMRVFMPLYPKYKNNAILYAIAIFREFLSCLKA